uniref:G051 VD Superfamily A precursor conopeptide n=1 Tax=Conus geographus TaxID=6491 RepID=X5IWP6_CONGE|nr:G051_VD_Superfamily_A_precursor_conopeptide [Conus geographus]
MGMRMMFTVFLLVVLATTVVSFPSERASDGRDDTAKDEGSDMEKLVEKKDVAILPVADTTVVREDADAPGPSEPRRAALCLTCFTVRLFVPLELNSSIH